MLSWPGLFGHSETFEPIENSMLYIELAAEESNARPEERITIPLLSLCNVHCSMHPG